MNKLILLILLFPMVCFAKPEWQTVTCGLSEPCVFRLNVPHGWLVTKGDDRSSVAFYTDEKHEWKID